MKLYLLTRNTDHCGYDYYDSAVVCADNSQDATSISPVGEDDNDGYWVPPEEISVKYLGEADISIARGVVFKSFNAG